LPDLQVNVSGNTSADLSRLCQGTKIRRHELASLLLDQIMMRPGLAKALIDTIDAKAYADSIGKNRARSAERFPFGGKMRTIAEISSIIKVPRETLRARVNAGWPLNRAFSSKKDNRGRKA